MTDDSPADAFLDAAQNAKDCDERAYYAYLGEQFGRHQPHLTRVNSALLELPFRCYLTVNFDPMLAIQSRTNKLGLCNIHTYPALDRRQMDNRTILYLHGFIKEGEVPVRETIVLSRKEFDAAYASNSTLNNLLVPTFENDPIVFVGCRLREPVMRHVITISKQLQNQRIKINAAHGRPLAKPPPRFIFLPRPEVRDEFGVIDETLSEEKRVREEGEYADLDITTVWYNASGPDHSALHIALETLAGLTPPTAEYGWSCRQ